MKRYLFDMPLELWKKLSKKAKKEDISVAQILRKLIRKWVEEK